MHIISQMHVLFTVIPTTKCLIKKNQQIATTSDLGTKLKKDIKGIIITLLSPCPHSFSSFSQHPRCISQDILAFNNTWLKFWTLNGSFMTMSIITIYPPMYPKWWRITARMSITIAKIKPDFPRSQFFVFLAPSTPLCTLSIHCICNKKLYKIKIHNCKKG